MFQIWRDSLHWLRSYCWGTVRLSIRPIFFEHPVGITMRWIKENGWHLLWWPRRALSPCKVWGRSYNTCRLYVRCLYVYRQDVAKRQTAGIKFSHKPKISFLATQGRLVALIHVKLGRAPGSAWLCKILSQSARGGWECGPKYQNVILFDKESPRRGELLDRFLKFLGLLYAELSYIGDQIWRDSLHKLYTALLLRNRASVN